MVEKPESLDDLRRIFSRLLGVSEEKLPFEFYERNDELVAHQEGYIEDYDKWFKVYQFARDMGRAEQAEDDRNWYFIFPKPKAEEKPSPLPLHLREEVTVPEAPEEHEKPVVVEEKPPLKPGYYPEFLVDRILSHPFSFRVNVEEGLDELMMEIHAAGMIIEPLICRPAKKSGYVELCAGERRLRAAKMIGMRTVPVIVKEMDDAEFDRVRFLENLARKDLTDMEVARVLDYLLKKYPKEYPTQEDLAKAFGKTQQWVSYHLGMLRLEEIFTTRVVNSKILSEILSKITERQARPILSAPAERLTEIVEWIVKRFEEKGEIPSAREIREFVRPVEAVPEAPEIPEAPLEKPPKLPEKPAIPCERCGRMITSPVHLKGKFYCEECAREVLAEKKPTKPMLSKSVVLEVLEKTLFPIYPRGVDFEVIKRELSDYDTYNLSDILIGLGMEGAIFLHDGKWMSREEYEKMQDVLDDLRVKMREAEQVLIDSYDFDPKRGLETYKMAEIKFLAKKNGPTADFLSALRRCVDLHKEYLRVLHGQEEFKSLKNDAASQNIAKIDGYLEKAEPADITGVTIRARLPCPICRRPLSRRAGEASPSLLPQDTDQMVVRRVFQVYG
jgi:ParB/RepB/Spo0J family partition protein